MEEGVKWMCRLCERIRKKPGEFFKAKCDAISYVPVINNKPPVDTDVKTIYLSSTGSVESVPNDSGVDHEFESENIKQVTQGEYLNTIKTKKKENITPDTCAQVMLAVIPGMTADTAKVVLDTIGNGTLIGLINALSVADTLNSDERVAAIKEKKKTLAVIPVKSGRKLGPALADKLWEYLFAKK